MGHNITAIILKGAYNNSKAQLYDLLGINMGYDLTMFHITHYYSAYWQAKLALEGMLDRNGVDDILYPGEYSICELISRITNQETPLYAIISTDYFGGIGEQYANVYKKDKIADVEIKTINQALSYMGIKKKKDMDEFDTIGLSNHRSTPEYLNKYVDLADELGV